MSKIYDVTLGASNGSSSNIPATGNKVKIYSAPGGAVNLRTDAGESFTLLEGQGFTLEGGKTFRDITVSNQSGQAQTCQIFVGDARVDDSRISGVVSIQNVIGAGIAQIEVICPTTINVLTTTVVVAVASNPRGLRVRKAAAVVIGTATGTADLRLIAAPVVPVSTVPANAYNMATASAVGALTSNDAHNDQNYLLPAGWGVWAVTQHLTSAPATAAVGFSYESL